MHHRVTSRRPITGLVLVLFSVVFISTHALAEKNEAPVKMEEISVNPGQVLLAKKPMVIDADALIPETVMIFEVVSEFKSTFD